MGNAGSSTIQRERHKSSSSDMPSSPVLKDGQAFVFDKYLSRERQGSSHEEEEPYYTKPAPKPVPTTATVELPATTRIASSESSVSLKDGAVIDPNKKKSLPTVVIMRSRTESITRLTAFFLFSWLSIGPVQMGRWRQGSLHQRNIFRMENATDGQESRWFCDDYRSTRGRSSVQVLRGRRMASRPEIGGCFK